MTMIAYVFLSIAASHKRGGKKNACPRCGTPSSSSSFDRRLSDARTAEDKSTESTGVAAVSNVRQFRKARDLIAWLDLVPRQHLTGGKTTLLGISKRGDLYIRRLIIHGARSCATRMDRSSVPVFVVR
jgi:hypothetical protein